MIISQDLIEMTMCKMEKDKDGKVSFEDLQATVSIADICERDAFR